MVSSPKRISPSSARSRKIDTAQQGRLSGSGRTQYRNDLSLFDPEADALENLVIPEGLMYIIDRNHLFSPAFQAYAYRNFPKRFSP